MSVLSQECAGEAQPHVAQPAPVRSQDSIGQRWQERFGGAQPRSGPEGSPVGGPQDGGDSVMLPQACANEAHSVGSRPGPSDAHPAPGVTSLLPQFPTRSAALDSPSSAQQVPVAPQPPPAASCFLRARQPKPRASVLRGQDTFLRPPVRPRMSSTLFVPKAAPPAPGSAPLSLGTLPPPPGSPPSGQAQGAAP